MLSCYIGSKYKKKSGIYTINIMAKLYFGAPRAGKQQKKRNSYEIRFLKAV